MLGNWDTPFKVTHNKVELFDNTTVFSAQNIIGHAGSTSASATDYVTRQANVLQYWSPAIAGVKVNVSYAPDEAPTTTTNKTKLSASATFDNHDLGLFVAAAYDSRADASVNGTSDTAARLVARYTLGDLWIGATVESIKVNTSATANYTQANSELVAAYKLGASNIGLSYAKAGETATAATGATQVSARYGYNFSKRTEGFVAYTSLKNDTAGTYSFKAGSFGSTAGSTSSAFGAGVIHSF
jgi:predicted porin